MFAIGPAFMVYVASDATGVRRGFGWLFGLVRG